MELIVPAIEVREVVKAFRGPEGELLPVLERLSFVIPPRQFVAVVGPSGCGKTTLLRVLDGLTPADGGEVRIFGRRVTAPGPDRAVVFQDFALLPWATVLENVAFPLEIRRVPSPERERRARAAIALVGLDGFEGYYPQALSGGMQQRVGLARALVVDPQVLLLDEPFGSLDAQTRLVLQDELLALWQRRPTTVVLVTHDMAEAVYLADRVLVMSPRPGRIVEEVPVPLPRPRDQSVRRSARFAELVEEVWACLRGFVRL